MDDINSDIPSTSLAAAAVQKEKVMESTATIVQTSVETTLILPFYGPINYEAASNGMPFVVKAPRPDSKLILQNMEEVLNSVKRKHRMKHRRKKEQKRLAQIAAAQAAAEGSEATGAVEELGEDSIFKTTTKSELSKKEKKRHKKPLQEKPLREENGINHDKSKHRERKSPKKQPSSGVSNGAGSILQHFSPTPKKCDDSSQASLLNVTEPLNIELTAVAAKPSTTDNVEVAPHPTLTSTPTTTKKATNAFDLLMSARNKVIGSNANGKDAYETTTGGAEVEAAETTLSAAAKRKQSLQDLVERKCGALKRKFEEEEEAREAYVEKTLQNRAKRFKKLLANGGSPKSKTSPKFTPKARQSQSAKVSKKRSAHKEKRGRTRRVSSSDSVDSLNTSIKNPVLEDTSENLGVNKEVVDDFLSKLSSPRKKLDSLLGYFPKKESPKESSNKLLTKSADTLQIKEVDKVEEVTVANMEAEVKLETPSTEHTTRGRLRKKQTINASSQNTSVICLDSSVTADEMEKATPSGRPKRSCAGKSRYLFCQDSLIKIEKDSEDTPSTGAGKTSKKRKKSENNSNLHVINVDGSPEKTPKKLASVFMRSLPKPSVDPLWLRARQEFLMSGVPEKIRLDQAKQKQHEQNYIESYELFPKISHVQQFNEIELKYLETAFELSSNIRLQSENVDITTPNRTTQQVAPVRSSERKKRVKKTKSSTVADAANLLSGSFAYSTATDIVLSPRKQIKIKVHQLLQLSTLENKRAIIKIWKADFDRFPTYKCYNQMRLKYRYFSAIDSSQDTEQVSESVVVTRHTRRSLERAKQEQNYKTASDADEKGYQEKPPDCTPNGELLFTEKYRPLQFEQVLVNLTPVTQLREFLSNWTSSQSGSLRNSEQFDESNSNGMDFGNDSNSNPPGTSSNTVVLLGPVSSGKTSAVFALANDMNFNVIEINAGMRRTGKRLIQELQEATQSHQIRKDSTAVAHGVKAQKNLLKITLDTKRQMSPSTSSKSHSNSDLLELQQSVASRKCIILIEDADIVFEQTDAGFTDALYTLAASSKRPVIMVASNPNCSHLQRLMQQNTIHFVSHNVLNAARYLAVLSLIENCPIHLDDFVSLYLFNKKDLRKTLLELQFFIQSGGDRQRGLQSAKSKQAEEEITPTKKETRSNTKSNKPTTTTLDVVDEVHNSPKPFFASSNKRHFSEESNHAQTIDERMPKIKEEGNVLKEVYMHGTLFQFYTLDQNAKRRVPFPTNFNLLRINLRDIFKVSHGIKLPIKVESVNNNIKRKTRSPKKTLLSNGNSVCSSDKLDAPSTAVQDHSNLNALCNFYENLSIATQLGSYAGNDSSYSSLNEFENDQHDIQDRLLPNMSECIAHELVEKSIEVNLEADLCPYNLFYTPIKRECISDYLISNSIANSSKRRKFLDYEPALRSICRSEKLRSSMERRSTRFYHYLRNYLNSPNLKSFSTEFFDKACEILLPESDVNTDHEEMQ